MKREEITVQAKLKPNCGLENTRASLVMRRIAPLCDSATCHPHAIKSSRETIPYLRDHGLFVTFVSRTPERVLAAISGAFFVDSCTIVEDPEGIPPFEMPSAPQEDDAENGGIEAISSFADRDARSERDEKLSNLIAQLEETNRSLRAHAESLPNDRVLSDIAFSYAQTLDHLRSTVALSRIEAFDRIAPSLHKLVEDYGRQFGVPVDLELEQGRMDLDRSVLASIEETLRRALRSCIRDGIESAEERADLGKPERATIRLRLENEGSDVVCRIEHDGRPFDAHRIATIASKRGLLARPLDAYSDEEIGAFILLPQFFLPSAASDGNAFAELNEIGCMLQRIGGRGTMRNTERGTLEIVLRFPVPFTVFEAALLRTGGVRFAVPAQQIVRFEAFDPARVQRGGAAGEGSKATSTWYEDEHGAHIEMLNQGAKPFPLDAAHPAYTVLLEALGERCALAADDVEGYERISMLQLPALLDRRCMHELGCIGYAILQDGSPCIVISVRRFLNDAAKDRGPMRDRSQRLHWIETLIGKDRQEARRNNALVIPTDDGDMAIAFSSIVEVVAASRVQPLALLPEQFCGVLFRGNELAPIVDTRAPDTGPGHVVLVEGEGCLLGLQFYGTPYVVDLDETEHALLAIERRPSFPSGTLPLLDIDAVAKALLALD